MKSIEIPLRLGRGQNDRGHWRTKHSKKSSEQEAVAWMLRGTPPAPPLIVTMTRIAPSAGLDDDNLVGACKNVRDQIARWLGVDDKNPSVQYRCAQERGPWGLRIEFDLPR